MKIYTDGSSWPNPGPGGWGIVIKNGSEDLSLSGFLAHTTSNQAELTAILQALKFSRRLAGDIVIFTDSKYCQRMLTGCWRPTTNFELLDSIWREIGGRSVEFRLIPRELNEADSLAVLARENGLEQGGEFHGNY